MARDLPHLLAEIQEAPLLIRSRKLDSILEAVGARIFQGADLAIDGGPREPQMARPGAAGMPGNAYMADSNAGIAVLPIMGTLVRRGGHLDSMSGLQSYHTMEATAENLFAMDGVRGILLEIDSFGGQATGCFELHERIRQLSETTGKPVWTHANAFAFSAAYLLATAGEEIWLTSSGAVGNVGVIAAHVDQSGADAKAGLKWTYFYAGETKADGNPHEAPSDRFQKEVKADVNALYERFCGLVANSRGVKPEEIVATGARAFTGADAVEAGLADHVGTMGEALSAFADRLRAGEVSERVMARSESMAKQGDGTETEGETVNPGETSAEGAGNQPEASGDTGGASEPEASADFDPLSERARCAGLAKVASQAAGLGVSFDLSAAISRGTSVEAARSSVMDAAANADDGSALSTISQPKGGGSGLNNQGGGNKRSAEANRSMWSNAHKRR